jgi:hypothetical protein
MFNVGNFDVKSISMSDQGVNFHTVNNMLRRPGNNYKQFVSLICSVFSARQGTITSKSPIMFCRSVN